jgi:hypothetical protein
VLEKSQRVRRYDPARTRVLGKARSGQERLRSPPRPPGAFFSCLAHKTDLADLIQAHGHPIARQLRMNRRDPINGE